MLRPEGIVENERNVRCLRCEQPARVNSNYCASCWEAMEAGWRQVATAHRMSATLPTAALLGIILAVAAVVLLVKIFHG